MKYEMIFGDEALFDGVPDECFCVAKNVYDENVYYKAVDACLFWLDGGKWKPLQFMSCTPIAMRQIIKEPKRWTWEDKKAGRLPEVGSTFTYKNETLTCLFIDADGDIWARDINDRVVAPWLKDCQPIETPEERAKWEREEWCSKALDSAGILGEMKRYELKRLGEYIGSIHDALQSGELPMPNKESE